jgi:hypothetical protein
VLLGIVPNAWAAYPGENGRRADEDADTTADNALFAVQGVFIP